MGWAGVTMFWVGTLSARISICRQCIVCRAGIKHPWGNHYEASHRTAIPLPRILVEHFRCLPIFLAGTLAPNTRPHSFIKGPYFTQSRLLVILPMHANEKVALTCVKWGINADEGVWLLLLFSRGPRRVASMTSPGGKRRKETEVWSEAYQLRGERDISAGNGSSSNWRT